MNQEPDNHAPELPEELCVKRSEVKHFNVSLYVNRETYEKDGKEVTSNGYYSLATSAPLDGWGINRRESRKSIFFSLSLPGLSGGPYGDLYEGEDSELFGQIEAEFDDVIGKVNLKLDPNEEGLYEVFRMDFSIGRYCVDRSMTTKIVSARVRTKHRTEDRGFLKPIYYTFHPGKPEKEVLQEGFHKLLEQVFLVNPELSPTETVVS